MPDQRDPKRTPARRACCPDRNAIDTRRHAPEHPAHIPYFGVNLVQAAMETWEPITIAELESLIAVQLGDCSPREQELFTRWRIPLRAVPISRYGHIESVYVVAQHGYRVMYYEDVEEGFNLSSLSQDGAIASPGFEQWELRDALTRFAA
jgi:hypothetical protein